MFPFLIHPNLYEQPMWLSKEEKGAPLQVFERLFENYKLHELRYILWQMVEACLTSENSEFAEPCERADLLLHYQELEKVLEAAHAIARERKTNF
jgi:hypothetical protein